MKPTFRTRLHQENIFFIWTVSTDKNLDLNIHYEINSEPLIDIFIFAPINCSNNKY